MDVSTDPRKTSIEDVAVSPDARSDADEISTDASPSEEVAVLQVLRAHPMGLSLPGLLACFRSEARGRAAAAMARLESADRVNWYKSDDEPPVRVYVVPRGDELHRVHAPADPAHTSTANEELRPVRICRTDPPPGAEVLPFMAALSPEARADVVRFAQLRAGVLDREELGRRVREIWIAWAREQPSPKASWLAPWEELSEPDREVDRRIGDCLYAMGAAYGDRPMRTMPGPCVGAALVDREALGREDYAASAETEAHRELLRKQWDYTSDGVRENHRRGAEHLYRMGQAHGDARLREAARALWRKWEELVECYFCGVALRAPFGRLHAALAEIHASPPTASWPAPHRETLELLRSMPEDQRGAALRYALRVPDLSPEQRRLVDDLTRDMAEATRARADT